MNYSHDMESSSETPGSETTRDHAPNASTSGGKESGTPRCQSRSTGQASSGIAITADGRVLTAKGAKLLESRAVDTETAVRYGVVSHSKAGGDWVSIPYFLDGVIVNNKHRAIIKKPDNNFLLDTDGVMTLWNVDCLKDDGLKDEPLIITEGEFDAICAIAAGFHRVTSVPNGAPKAPSDNTSRYDYLDKIEELRDITEIIICSDGDNPGAALFTDLSLRLGRSRCKWVKYPKGCKDLNDAMQAYGEKGVQQTILRAQWCQVDGIYRMSDLPPVEDPPVMNIGFEVMGAHYNIREGDLCVVTGIPSHGKSTFVNDVICRMAYKHGWVSGVASFEQHPQVDHRRSLRQWHSRKMHMTPKEIEAADVWIDESFSFIVPHEDDDVTLDWCLSRCQASVIQHGAKIIVIDPWNEMDHDRQNGQSLTEYTGYAIKQFKKFARKHRVHMIIVAHPTKQKKNDDGSFSVPTLYDISDSAHWYNKADVGIVVHRKEHETLIRISKSRYHDKIGKPGDVAAIYTHENRRYQMVDPDVKGGKDDGH